MGQVFDKCCPKKNSQQFENQDVEKHLDDNNHQVQLVQEQQDQNLDDTNEILLVDGVQDQKVFPMMQFDDRGFTTLEEGFGTTLLEPPLHMFITEFYIDSLQKQFLEKIEKNQFDLKLIFEKQEGFLIDQKSFLNVQEQENSQSQIHIQKHEKKWNFSKDQVFLFNLNFNESLSSKYNNYEVLMQEYSQSEQIYRKVVLKQFIEEDQVQLYNTELIIYKKIDDENFLEIAQCISMTEVNCMETLQSKLTNLSIDNQERTLLRGTLYQQKENFCIETSISMIDSNKNEKYEEIEERYKTMFEKDQIFNERKLKEFWEKFDKKDVCFYMLDENKFEQQIYYIKLENLNQKNKNNFLYEILIISNGQKS